MTTENDQTLSTTPSADEATGGSAPAENGSALPQNFIDPDYGSFVEDAGSDDADPSPPPAQPAPVQGSTPAAPAASAPESPAAPVAPAPAAAEAPPPAAAAPSPAAPAQPVNPSQPPVDYAELERQVHEALQKKLSLSPEEAAKVDELGAKPSEYLPAILARVYTSVYQDAVRSVMGQIPSQFDMVMAQRESARQNEDVFFNRWPQLKGKDQEVIESIKIVRAANPQIDKQALIEKAGALTLLNLGLSPQPAASPGQVGQPAAAPLPPPRPAMPGSGVPGGGMGRTPSYEEQVFNEMVSKEFDL
jgi:acyl-CoA-binding protein